MAIVLYPGSFDPIHLGHLDVVEQAVELFGHVIVAVMHNHEKPSGCSRSTSGCDLISESVAEAGIGEHVDGHHSRGLAVDAARSDGADFIVKGLRNAGDFEIEQQMALTNHSVTGCRTVYLPCGADRGFISSRFVREIARYGGVDRPPRAGCRWPARSLPDSRSKTTPAMRNDDDRRLRRLRRHRRRVPRAGARRLRRRRRDAPAPGDRHHRQRAERCRCRRRRVIDRDEILELLEEALERLPDELRQARWMLKERQEFLAKTRREADEILDAARVRAERMVQRTEVVRAAEQRARQVIETAETDARRLRHETEDFLDQRLGSFEIVLDKLQKTVAGRAPAAVDRRSDARTPTSPRTTTRPRASSTRTADGADPIVRSRRAGVGAERHERPARRLVVNAAELLREPGATEHVVHELDAADVDARRCRRRPAWSTSTWCSASIARRHRGHRHASPCPGPGRAGAACARWPRRCGSTSRSATPSDPARVDGGTRSRSSAADSTSAPMVRDAVLLGRAARAAVPAGLRRACAPTCGADRNDVACDRDAPAARRPLGRARRAAATTDRPTPFPAWLRDRGGAPLPCNSRHF